MKIWLVNPYALPPGSGGSERHTALARELASRGHRVTVIAGSFNHFTGEDHPQAAIPPGESAGEPFLRLGDGVRFGFVPVRRYRGNGWGRLVNMVGFCPALLRIARRVPAEERPDVVAGSSLHLFGAFAAWWLARRWGCGFVLEIRDIWPETLIDLYGWRGWHPFALVHRWLADFLYRHSPEIVTTLPLAESHFRERGAVAPVTWIPNGCRIDNLPAMSPEVEGGGPPQPLVLSYAGSLAHANALDDLFEAFRLLRDELAPGELRVQVIGEGPLGDSLRQAAREQRLDFVEFRGRLSRAETMECLRRGHASVLTIRRSPIYRWGFSMNKLADYLAAGRPVILADVCDYRPVAEAGCGWEYPAGDALALAGAIRRALAASPAERAAMGERARNYARENFDWAKLAGRLEAVLVRAAERNRAGAAPGGRAYPLVKRSLDLAAAGAALLLLAPLLLVLAVLVALVLGRPVLFRQTRIGRGGKPFALVKFRSMTNARDPSGELLPDAQRLNRFGRFLRSTSLDELPELWNVLCGDLSLVGPRPLLPEYVPLYNAHQARRHEVAPGITGWAQVNGRNATSWEERFDMDVWYVEHRSLALDFRILCRTIRVVLGASGIAAEGSATMPKFTGSPGQDRGEQHAAN